MSAQPTRRADRRAPTLPWTDSLPQTSAPATPAAGIVRTWVDASGVRRGIQAGAGQFSTTTTGAGTPSASESNGSVYLQTVSPPVWWARVSGAWVQVSAAAILALSSAYGYEAAVGVGADLSSISSTAGSFV